MTLFSDDHYKLMEMFEREFAGRKDREAKEWWPKGRVYQDGQVNELFLAFRRGVAYGVATSR